MLEIEKIREFVSLVQEMRNVQKEYFATRQHSSLTKSKCLEKKVDAEITNMWSYVYAAKHSQLEFTFDNTREKAVQ